jgi:hypothetical protein
MTRITTLLGLAAVAALPFASPATGQQQPKPEPGKPREIQPVQRPETLGLWRASQIIGQNVEDANGKNAGKIEDLMVDGNGDVVYGILSFGGLLGVGDKLYAVPWSAMQFNHENGKIKSVVLDVTKERLERAPSFTRDRWPDRPDRAARREADRYWGDSALAAKVKSKLAADRAGTMTQINVDSNQGTVRLSGTVANEAQKRRAAELARQVDGVRAVKNELQVKAGG